MNIAARLKPSQQTSTSDNEQTDRYCRQQKIQKMQAETKTDR